MADVRVRAAVRFAIDISTVVGKKPVSAGLEVGVPHICLTTQIGRLYRGCPCRTRLFVTGFTLPGILLILAAARSQIFGLPGLSGPSTRCSRLLIAGIDDPGPLSAVTVEIAASLVAVRPVSIVRMAATAATPIIVMRIPPLPIAVTPIVPRPISARSPIAMVAMMPVMTVVPVTAGEETHIERPPAPAQTEVPATPRVVVDVKSPGAVTGIVAMG
jgi:hypothetical protein